MCDFDHRDAERRQEESWSFDSSSNVFGMQWIGWQRQWSQVFMVLLRCGLEGLTAYGLALHGYVPDLNLSGNGPSADDENGSAQEPDGS
jgi:hypothetical protein